MDKKITAGAGSFPAQPAAAVPATRAEAEFFLGNLTGYPLAGKERIYYEDDVAKVAALIVEREHLKANVRDFSFQHTIDNEKIETLAAALKPFADLGVGPGPDDEVDAASYRILRGAIRNARAALSKTEA